MSYQFHLDSDDTTSTSNTQPCMMAQGDSDDSTSTSNTQPCMMQREIEDSGYCLSKKATRVGIPKSNTAFYAPPQYQNGVQAFQAAPNFMG